MKKKTVWILILFPLYVQAQLTEYNQKGDEAMQQKDYQDAKMWYEEGVSYCNPYSINRLIDIWTEDRSIRSSMGPVMNKCLDCLHNMAISRRDTLAMKKLIFFYTEGIGTSKDETSANSWQEMLEQIRNPYVAGQSRPGKPREKMKFFAGFSASSVAPVGIQIGSTGAVGWYARIRTNLVFPQNTAVKCENGRESGGNYTGTIPEFDHKSPPEMYRFTSAALKKSLWTGTVGIVFRVMPNVYLSAGAGYAQYSVLHEYEKIDNAGSPVPNSRGWAINTDESFKSAAIDVDAKVVFGKQFYGTAGCSMLHLKSTKHIYPNIGIGYFFTIK
ncbi:MAG: hypothetical protein LBD27_04910 [Tannerella sp.]|jgi:hypothetical protein|nr:hypothetical protein [Tannerella sp.]